MTTSFDQLSAVPLTDLADLLHHANDVLDALDETQLDQFAAIMATFCQGDGRSAPIAYQITLQSPTEPQPYHTAIGWAYGTKGVAARTAAALSRWAQLPDLYVQGSPFNLADLLDALDVTFRGTSRTAYKDTSGLILQCRDGGETMTATVLMVRGSALERVMTEGVDSETAFAELLDLAQQTARTPDTRATKPKLSLTKTTNSGGLKPKGGRDND